MKVRFEFTSGIPSREVETSRTLEELLFAEFGTRLNFENLGGKAIILGPSAEVAPEEAVAEVALEAPIKSKRKAKAE